MLHAHVRGCPEATGLGRFLQSAPVSARAKSRYSEFRYLSQTLSVKPTIFS
jgi:predicted ATPase